MNKRIDPHLEARVAKAPNARKSDAEAKRLRAEYLADPTTSYRKLAIKHGLAVSTVVRLIGKAALLSVCVLGLCVDGWGCSAPPPAPGRDWTLRLAPEAALADVVEDWATRWSAATGRRILVGTDGAPVTAEDDLTYPGQTLGNDCGQTEVTYVSGTGEWLTTTWMHIDLTPPPRCSSWDYSVGHEMAHALSACKHSTVEGSLMQTALEPGQSYRIDGAALELVCGTSECTQFVPEVSP